MKATTRGCNSTANDGQLETFSIIIGYILCKMTFAADGDGQYDPPWE